jgi:hypothetical protein
MYSLGSQNPQLDAVLRTFGLQHLVGHHFFENDTPIFALDQLDHEPFPVARVRKRNETEAPNLSCLSTPIEGNVKWLFLKDSEGVSQGGLDAVYRVETVGGNRPATCRGQKPNLEVHYVAQCKCRHNLIKKQPAEIQKDWLYGLRELC